MTGRRGSSNNPARSARSQQAPSGRSRSTPGFSLSGRRQCPGKPRVLTAQTSGTAAVHGGATGAGPAATAAAPVKARPAIAARATARDRMRGWGRTTSMTVGGSATCRVRQSLAVTRRSTLARKIRPGRRRTAPIRELGLQGVAAGDASRPLVAPDRRPRWRTQTCHVPCAWHSCSEASRPPPAAAAASAAGIPAVARRSWSSAPPVRRGARWPLRRWRRRAVRRPAARRATRASRRPRAATKAR